MGRLTRLSLCALLAGCTQPARPLAIPPAGNVARIDFTRWSGTENQGMVRIHDREQVERILALLALNNAGYFRRRYRFGPGEPTGQQYSIAVQGELSVPLVVWVGPDWLGGVDETVEKDGWRQARYRPLGPAERAELLRACGGVP